MEQTEKQRKARRRFIIQHDSRSEPRRILRATIANITPEELALKVNEHNDRFPGLTFAATIYASVGVFEGKIESGATIEITATWFDTFGLFVSSVLTVLGEDSAYMTEQGDRAFLLYADGILEEL